MEEIAGAGDRIGEGAEPAFAEPAFAEAVFAEAVFAEAVFTEPAFAEPLEGAPAGAGVAPPGAFSVSEQAVVISARRHGRRAAALSSWNCGVSARSTRSPLEQ